LTKNYSNIPITIINIVAQVIIYYIGYVSMTNIYNESYNGIKIGLKQALLMNSEKFIRVISANIIYMAIVMVGALLFVVPGVYWGLIYLFAGIAAIIEKKEISPFKYSAGLSKGNAGGILIILLICAIPWVAAGAYVVLNNAMENTAIMTAHTVFSAMLWPLTHGFIVITYCSLKTIGEKIDTERMTSIGEGKGCMLAILSVFVIMISFIVAAYFVVTIASKNKEFRKAVMKFGSMHNALENGVKIGESNNWNSMPFGQKKILLTNSEFKDIYFIQAVSIPALKFGISPDKLDIMDKNLAKSVNSEIIELNSKKDKQNVLKYDSYKLKKSSLIKISGREWIEVVLEYVEPVGKKSFLGRQRKILYTVNDGSVTAVDYFYLVPDITKENQKLKAPADIAKKEVIVREFIGKFIFPEQKTVK
jgi:hypothetical protein